MSKNLIYMNIIENRMNQFAIGYMINPTLYDNKVFNKKGKNS